MKVSRIVSSVFVVAVALALALPALAAGEAVAGIGTVSAGEEGCPPDNLQLVVTGVETEDGQWLFDVAAVNNDPLCVVGSDFPLIAITVPFGGAWDPSTGGCMPAIAADMILGPLNLCLTNPQPDGGITTYDFAVCEDPPCSEEDSGSVQLVHVG